MLPAYTNVHRHGRPGDKQDGIDAVADEGVKHVGFQYRRVKQYGPTAFAKTVSDVTYKADDYVVVIARRASSLTRKAVRKKRKWELWDQEDVSVKVRSLPEAKSWRLLGQYFEPSVRTRFLGRLGPATFRDIDDHFRPTMEEGRLFDHRADLVGRDDELQRLRGFLEDATSSIAVLPGRGGLGKTRILKTFGEAFQDGGLTVLFAAENATFDRAALDEIPHEPCLLFVDDAHRSKDLPNLLSDLSRRRLQTKLVLSIRPEGRPGLLGRLGSAGVDVRSVTWFPELDELSDEQGTALARSILGEDFGHLAHEVYQATRDCTLVTVVAARLLRERQLSPVLLVEDKEFRDGVLERFRQQMLANVGDSMPLELRGKMPRIVDVASAVQPFSLDEQDLVTRAANYVGVVRSDFARAVDDLEQAGLLVRRGYSVRIVPDVLGDYILGSACLTSTGMTTGFAKEMIDVFSEVAFERLLANLAELDWRVRSFSRSAPDLAGPMWADFRKSYELAGNLNRQTLLGWLRSVGPYQPSRVVDVAEWTVANPASDGAGDDFRVDRHSAVLSMLPSILEPCAYGPELERVCNLLWRTGRDDDRETGRLPDHPIRVLARIGEYGPHKPLGVCERVAAVATRWLEDPAVESYAHSPFEIIGGFLAKAGLDPVPAADAVRFNHFTVNPDTTGPLRSQVITTVKEQASSAHPRVALAAVKLLGDALADPIGFFGRVVTTEEKARWEAEQIAMFGVLQEVASKRDEPIILLKIRDAARWFVTRGQSAAVREAARQTRLAVPMTFELELTGALLSPWAWDEELGD